MFHSMLYRRTVASTALLFAASCSDGPTGPPASSLEHAGTVASQRSRYVANGDVLKRTFAFSRDVSRSATITPEGGVLAFPEAGLFLIFPPGALTQTTVVTATALKGNRVAYDFQPHGTLFATPIYVAQGLLRTELHGRGSRGEKAVWGGYLLNGASDIGADGSANFSEVFSAFFQGKGSDRLAVFSTTHFSGYAMASGIRETRLPLPGQE